MSANTDHRQQRLVIQRLKELPPLPLAAQQILQVMDDPAVSMDRIAGIIEQDPALAGRILGLANSAFFRRNGEITSIKEAIIRALGMNVVKSLAIGMAMGGVFDTSRCPAFDLERYWSSAFLTARSAALLGRQMAEGQAIDPAPLFLCGLLHNFGLLVLVHCFPQELNRALEQVARRPGERLADHEAQVLGFDHHEAGGWLARRWHLPEVVVTVIEHHHEEGYQGPWQREAGLIDGCARWARALMAGQPLPGEVRERLLGSGVKEAALDRLDAAGSEMVEEIAGLTGLLAD
ncbi:MAG: HDOD domain-containing protein [Gammaproteobacteria bacterium]|nr:MAG: HDOD domain-containing protein [Gammaproteobacteria bacterium]